MHLYENRSFTSLSFGNVHWPVCLVVFTMPMLCRIFLDSTDGIIVSMSFFSPRAHQNNSFPLFFFAAITSLNCFLSETLVLVNPVCFSGLLTIPIRSLIFLLLALIS